MSQDTIESLRARVAELEAERNQWMANSRENKLIAEQCNRELTAKDQRIAELEYQLDVVTNNPDDPAYWLHSSKQLLEKS